MSSHGLPERTDFMTLVAAQDGFISRAQARVHRITDRMIDYRLKEGIWERFLPSVFRLPGHRHSWRQRLIGSYLWGGPTAVVAHRSAAIWWGLEGIPEYPIDVTLDTNRRAPAPWIVVHRSRSIRRDIVHSGAVRLTSARWTLLDLAAVVREITLERAIDEAVRRGLVSLTDLKQLLDPAMHGGRPGTRTLRRLVDDRDASTSSTESRLEEEALAVLRRGGLPEPTRQYEVIDDGRVVARIDFAYPDHRIAMECDGLAFHFGREAWHRDRDRLNNLVLRGWRVLRVTWRDVRERPDQVVGQMKMLLSQAGFRPGQR